MTTLARAACLVLILPGVLPGKPSKGVATSSTKAGWNEIQYRGRTYVSLKDTARFYGLDHQRRGKSISLKSDAYNISTQTSSKAMVLNGLTFYLSHPVLPWADRALVSNFDVVHIIDPILRPAALREPSELTTIILDPAHGGQELGITGDQGIEKDIVLDLARQIRAALGDSAFRVVLTRDGDVDFSVEERLMLAAAAPGESVYVSLHLGTGTPKARGMEIFTLPPSGTPATYDPRGAGIDESFYPGNINDRENLALAVAIQGQALQERLVSAGIKRARFSELKGIACPAVYCRAGFLSHWEEAELLSRSSHLNRLAYAFAKGIRRYARVMGDGAEQVRLIQSQSPLLISNVAVLEDLVRSSKGERRRLHIDIQSRPEEHIDPDKVDIQVYFFDLVNRETIELSRADPPRVRWISVLPDWKAIDTEVLEVSYHLPPQSSEEVKALGQRFYYGFIVRLIYEGKLVDAYAAPANLRRCLEHFTTVFPR